MTLREVLLATHLRVCQVLIGSRDVASLVTTNGRLEVADGDQVLVCEHLPQKLTLANESWRALINRIKADQQQCMRHRRLPLLNSTTRHLLVISVQLH